MEKSQKISTIVFLFSLSISITIGAPSFFLNDEIITGNQLNHLVNDVNPFYGYDKYSGGAYATAHKNVLCYSLALPILSLPSYYLLNIFQDYFAFFVNCIWFFSLLLFAILIQLWFPKWSQWKGIPWVYGVIFGTIVFFIFNILLFKADSFQKYGEIAAVVFTNHIFFALFCVLVFLIARVVLDSDWWGIFGVFSMLCCSSALFWSGNAKDHMATIFLIALSAYFFVLFIKYNNYFNLVSSFLSIGLLAWVREELGLAICVSFLITALILSLRKGYKDVFRAIGCSIFVLFGALPLFINNYAVTGNPLLHPMTLYRPYLATSKVLLGENKFIITDLFGILVRPNQSITAGIFQVSPLSFFGIISLVIIVFSMLLKRERKISGKDKDYFLFLSLWAVSLILIYIKSLHGLPISKGIGPDIRYLAPMYLPLILLGFYALKFENFTEMHIKSLIETLAFLILINLPIYIIILQIGWGRSLESQLLINMFITYAFLINAVAIFFLAFIKRINLNFLAYSIAALMVSSLAWEIIVDFVSLNIMQGGYYLWIPTVRWIRHIIIILFV